MGNVEDSESTVVKKATATDAPAILELVKEHLKESVYSWLPVSDEKIVDTVLWFIEQDPKTAYLIVVYDKDILAGIVACVSIPLTFTESKVSGELLWLVRKDYRGSFIGKKLLNLLEEWSRLTNHGAIQVGSNDKRTDKLLKHLGYKEKSRTFIKVIDGN